MVGKGAMAEGGRSGSGREKGDGGGDRREVVGKGAMAEGGQSGRRRERGGSKR